MLLPLIIIFITLAGTLAKFTPATYPDTSLAIGETVSSVLNSKHSKQIANAVYAPNVPFSEHLKAALDRISKAVDSYHHKHIDDWHVEHYGETVRDGKDNEDPIVLFSNQTKASFAKLVAKILQLGMKNLAVTNEDILPMVPGLAAIFEDVKTTESVIKLVIGDNPHRRETFKYAVRVIAAKTLGHKKLSGGFGESKWKRLFSKLLNCGTECDCESSYNSEEVGDNFKMACKVINRLLPDLTSEEEQQPSDVNDFLTKRIYVANSNGEKVWIPLACFFGLRKCSASDLTPVNLTQLTSMYTSSKGLKIAAPRGKCVWVPNVKGKARCFTFEDNDHTVKETNIEQEQPHKEDGFTTVFTLADYAKFVKRAIQSPSNTGTQKPHPREDDKVSLLFQTQGNPCQLFDFIFAKHYAVSGWLRMLEMLPLVTEVLSMNENLNRAQFCQDIVGDTKIWYDDDGLSAQEVKEIFSKACLHDPNTFKDKNCESTNSRIAKICRENKRSFVQIHGKTEKIVIDSPFARTQASAFLDYLRKITVHRIKQCTQQDGTIIYSSDSSTNLYNFIFGETQETVLDYYPPFA